MFDLPELLQTPEPPTKEALRQHYRDLFPSYDWRPHEDYLKLAKEACWMYDDIINKKEKRWLSMCGHSGTGKTAWAKAIRTALRNQGRKVQMWDWSTVCEDHLAKGNYDILRHLQSMPILIIDEVGKSDWSTGTNKLSHLLDQRLGKWTILISNMTQGDIARKLDVRISSRMERDRNRIIKMGKDCPDYHNLIKKK